MLWMIICILLAAPLTWLICTIVNEISFWLLRRRYRDKWKNMR